MLLIYIPKFNQRIDYAIEVCFKHAFKLDYRITSDLNEFEKSDKRTGEESYDRDSLFIQRKQ